MTRPLTLAAAKVELRSLGMTINKNQFDEYRVNFSGPEGTEANAYYTNDLDDAVKSGRAMAERRDLMKNIRLCALFEAVFSNGQTERRPPC